MTAEDKKTGEIVLFVLGAGFLLWLIFRHSGTQTAIAPGGVPVSLPSIGTVPPDYLTYNVPADGKTSLPGVSPIGLPTLMGTSPFSWTPPGQGTADPSSSSPSCACSGGSTSDLFSNLGNLVNYYTSQGGNLVGNYAANILSAFPSASSILAASGITSAGGSGGPKLDGTVAMS